MKKSALLFLILLGGIVVSWKWLKFGSRLFLSPPEISGGVLRTDEAAGGRLYYLTTQWEKRVSRSSSRSSSSTRTDSWLNTDLWELDAATAQPLSRRRIKRDKVNGDHKAMGMEQGVLWARIPELVGIRLADGEIIADSAKIEARNPALAGLMPKPAGTGIFLPESMQPLKFIPQSGMIVRLDDARQVRIDPLTLEATPYVKSKPTTGSSSAVEASAPALGMAPMSISNGMDWYAMVRGLAMQGPEGGGQWLGLLSEPELATLQENHLVGHQMDFSTPARQKLYRAELKTVQEFLGPLVQYMDPAALPESPEFLMAGLLTQGSGGSSGQSAMWRRQPDSVFVLSRDRLGDQGRLQLARISGPKGTPVWSIALPLSNMSAWIPGERHALMLGPDPSAQRSPMAEEGENTVHQILAINLETGAVQSFNPDLHRDWPVQDAKVEKP
ncbi:PA2928 family protein [Luteolibacter sp. Populi]|uniref:PA2928 family protein n=1 Tax=Luteolibacter sp. Populi TaxID=3230487 RepID=UPI003467BF1E